jgi:hypothetical protein
MPSVDRPVERGERGQRVAVVDRRDLGHDPRGVTVGTDERDVGAGGGP